LSRAQSRATLDRIGVALSMSCALHCLFTPLLVASVSLGAIGRLASEGTELALLSLATTLAAVVLVWGWHAHRRLGSLGLFAVALVLIGAGRFLAPEPAETPMVVAGGLSIALAHVVNARLCRLCTGCQAAAGAILPPGLSATRCSPTANPATPSRPALREHAASSTLRER
jgi:MerC mercury resistance protein